MLIEVNVAQRLDRARDTAVVAIPLGVSGHQANTSEESALATAQSVLRHAPPSTPILIVGSDREVRRLADDLDSQLARAELVALQLDPGVNGAAAVNAAVRVGVASDLVLVMPGIVVAAGWLDRLRDAAMSDTTVASATPLSLGNAGIGLADGESASEPDRASAIDRLSEELGRRAPRLHPRIATIGPGCAYVRRSVFEVAGTLDEGLPLADALADLAVRSIAAGMVHVAADDVLVGGTVVGVAADAGHPQRGIDALRDTIDDDPRSRLRRAVGIGRTVLRRLSVTLDARALVSALGGTQTYIIGLVQALTRDGRVALRVLIPPDLSERARDSLMSLPDVEFITYQQAVDGVSLSSVVHRPQQVFTVDDLDLLRLVGERIVIGQQDLISYHNHSYHADVEHWRSYRRVTRMSLAAADQVVFFSEHARRDAMFEDVVSPDRAHVVGIGAAVHESPGVPERRPDSMPDARSFILCLGADYAHKNRPFAIELLGALHSRGWDGWLVLAGTHVRFGSSRDHEQQLLSADPDLAACVVDLGPVDEAGKAWLYARTRALVFPTLYEGFGLLPLEAASWNVPCLFAAQASLSELAADVAILTPWDADASASATLPLLSDGPERDAHVARLRGVGFPAWEEVAEELVAIYQRAVEEPPSAAAPRVWQELQREGYIVALEREVHHLRTTAEDYQDAYHGLERRVATGLPLIDEGGLLSISQQRGLMRVAARRGLGSVLLAPFGVLGRRERGSSPRLPSDHAGPTRS